MDGSHYRMEMGRGRRPIEQRGGSGRAVRWGENRIAEAVGLRFEAVEEAPSPDEFRRQNTQGEKNRQPAGSGGDDHDHAESQESESEEDFQEALSLLESAYQHVNLKTGAAKDWADLWPPRLSMQQAQTKLQNSRARGIPM